MYNIQTVRPCLCRHSEVRYVELSNIASMSIKQKGTFEMSLKSFYICSHDPTHVKLLKLVILTKITMETNILMILQELQVSKLSKNALNLVVFKSLHNYCRDIIICRPCCCCCCCHPCQ